MLQKALEHVEEGFGNERRIKLWYYHSCELAQALRHYMLLLPPVLAPHSLHAAQGGHLPTQNRFVLHGERK